MSPDSGLDVMPYAVMGQILGLLLVANGAPIIARDLLGDRGHWPLDFGCVFFDGRPLLGPSKTIRGLVAAVGATGCAAPLLGYDFATGAYVGLLTMIGDLLSSFLKRRLGIASSDSALGLDQGLEALVPLLVLQEQWALRPSDMVAITAMFFVLDVALSRLLYKLHIRKRPL
ncbi:MAG: CDP-archaeol synthase [Candidatus Tectomicrobia bacterium]|nr:CDP-archaeol synthase [Candidatus Tectomicrobia bacterium]